jgi:hypothetical protein
MKTSTFQKSGLVSIAAALFLLANSSQAQAVSLTGINGWTIVNGSYGGQGWDIVGANGSANIYVTQSLTGAFLNSGNSAATSINIPLQDGDNTFYYFGWAGFEVFNSKTWGLGVFLNGDSINPAIAAYSSVSYSQQPQGFSASSNLVPTLGFSSLVNGPNGLSFRVGNQQITLKDLIFYSANTFRLDRVSGASLGGDGNLDAVAKFTLTVTSVEVPEPNSILGLLIAGAMGVIPNLSNRV